ncbi:gliding motility-associated protein GldE [Rurimicrobium arvi]|uniref:Gliding motility-associated protein GldE n=1 Tax=Rurimicrobium arvi TaxID=2049916 RepID=A0ABP8MP16_9BACT
MDFFPFSAPLTILNAAAVQAAPSSSQITILLIIITLLLLLTAISAGAETAFFSLKAKDINELMSKDNSASRQAIRLLDQPQRLLATILVTNNFLNISIVITTNLLVNNLFHDLSPVSLFFVQVVAVTFLLVLFGEVLPKVYATQNNMQMALFAAPVLSILSRVLKPVSSVFVNSSKYIETRIGTRRSNYSQEEFEQAIELTVGPSATTEEVNIFKGILKFGNITAKQIMRTRMDVSGIPEQFDFNAVKKYAIEMGYSRLPVYRENLDQISGMINTKDFLLFETNAGSDWHTLIRPAYFIHEGKLIEDLLKEFQQKRIHFAIVVDEFGGTSGIVTLEDIMEEIIGDIKDEFDEEELNYRKLDDHNFIFDGKASINDVARYANIPFDDWEDIRGDSDSLAGLVLEISGRFPKTGDVIRKKNYSFAILEMDKMRITKIKLTILPAEEQAS